MKSLPSCCNGTLSFSHSSCFLARPGSTKDRQAGSPTFSTYLACWSNDQVACDRFYSKKGLSDSRIVSPRFWK